MRKFSLLLISTLLTIVSCSNKGADNPNKVKVKLDPFFITSKSDYELEFSFDDNYFTKDANSYDKDLSLLSFGASVSTNGKDNGEGFYSKLGFKDFIAKGYDSEPTMDSISYYLAHKSIGDYELFATSPRSFLYGAEFGNNLVIGKSGDHNGFYNAANSIYKDLQKYISTYKGDKQIKLWINGYSRGGAIANTLASIILREKKLNVTNSNMFVYTFEAPNCLDFSNVIAYQNVHNIINGADLVINVPPTRFQLGRCGVDYLIYNKDASIIVKEFDKDIEMPEFTPMEIGDAKINGDAELLKFALDSVFNANLQGDDAQYSCSNREEYTDRYQTSFTHLFEYTFQMEYDSIIGMFSDLSKMGWAVATLIADESGETFAAFLKGYYDKEGVIYDNEKLPTYCQSLIKALVYLFNKILAIYTNKDYAPSLTRLINMHYPETNYALLLHKHKNS